MPLIPWRLFRSWKCLMCGICCRRYVVPLAKNEAKFYSSIFGDVVLDKVGGKIVLRKIGNKCVFQSGKLCSIQEFKPIRCKLWPFIVLRKPINDRTAKMAEFEFGGEIFYVYVDTFCMGLNSGGKPIEEAVFEAVRDFVTYSPERKYFEFVVNKRKFLSTNISSPYIVVRRRYI